MQKNLDEIPVLIAYTGPLNGQKWLIERDMIIGREPECDIVIPDRQVSRMHTKVFLKREGVFIEDLGSKNGTHINGIEVISPVLLKDGDIIQIALAQKFVFMSADATLPLEADHEDTLEKPARLAMDIPSRRVWIGGKELFPPLSAPQFALLKLLYENKGEVVSRSRIIEAVWGSEAVDVSEQALDALVRRLRNRLAEYDPNHHYIKTIRGHGLRLDNPIE